MRLDRFLATLPDITTRSQVKHLIDGGRVQVDDRARKASYAVRAGERVAVELPPPAPSTVEPEALPLVVLYEDDDLVVIDKPPGMVVHPAAGVRSGTVVNALLHRLGGIENVGAHERPGIVHRLDRDTSGVLVVARTLEALEGLARQFRQRTLEKEYVAVVHGRVAAKGGVIDQPIGRDPRERKRMSVRSRAGRAAVTRWEVAERLAGATVLRLFPKTGRTHQLRVHLAALGHPIVGDAVYGGRNRRARGVSDAVAAALAACPRQALHARRLRFAHPRDGRTVEVEAPLPDDLRRVIDATRVADPR
jgi:23S rRNA pseudouridine1911/1915/1917 synthase